MDLVIKRDGNIKQKLIKKVLSIDTALLNTFRYTFCNVNKTKCFLKCRGDGPCVPMCDKKKLSLDMNDDIHKFKTSNTQCHKECVARNNFKNRAFPIDSADFTMDTPDKVYKVLTMKLAHISLPRKIYNISSELKNNYFRIWDELSLEHIIEIPPGMYSIKEIVNVMSIAVVNLQLRFYYDKIIDRVYILAKNREESLVIDFSHIAGCQNMDDNTTLGWALGFRLPAYTTDSLQSPKGTDYQDIVDKRQDEIEGNWPDAKFKGYSYEYTMPFMRGEAINMISSTNVTVGAPILDPTDQEDFVNVTAENIEDGGAARPNEIYGIIGEASPSILIDYVYVVVDDFNRNKNDEYMTSANKFSNVLAKIPLITRQGQIFIGDIKTIHKQRTYFSPVNIEKLRVKILDRFGRKLDLGINTINATIEFDCEYS